MTDENRIVGKCFPNLFPASGQEGHIEILAAQNASSYNTGLVVADVDLMTRRPLELRCKLSQKQASCLGADDFDLGTIGGDRCSCEKSNCKCEQLVHDDLLPTDVWRRATSLRHLPLRG